MKKYVLLFVASLFFVCHSNAQQVINGDLSIGDYNSKTGYGNYLYLKGTAWNNSSSWLCRYTYSDYKTDLRICAGGGVNQRFVVGEKTSETNWIDNFVVTGRGNVGIGVSYPTRKLEVNGTIIAKEIIVQSSWADFVFKPEYNLPSLSEVEAHIKKHHHLPGIPSEAEVLENGVGLGDMQVKLLQKIEELTLYTIQQQKIIEGLVSKIERLENSNK